MKRPTRHEPRLFLLAALGVAAGTVMQPAAADVVQGTVTPAGAKVIIKDGGGKQVSELAGGPFQIRLPAGRFQAECQSPSRKTVQIFSLAQPTTVNIDCS